MRRWRRRFAVHFLCQASNERLGWNVADLAKPKKAIETMATREVQFGPRRVVFPSEQLGVLTQSRADEPSYLLRDRLERDGYLYIPQLLNR